MDGTAIMWLFASLLALTGLIFMSGRGAGLINMPRARRDEWDEKVLCRFVGRYLLFLAVCFLLIILGEHVANDYVGLIAFVMVLGSSAWVVIRLWLPRRGKNG